MAQQKVKYKQAICGYCKQVTSFVEVDTVDGKKWQCEVCGKFEGE